LSFPKVIFIGSICVLALIAGVAAIKKFTNQTQTQKSSVLEAKPSAKESKAPLAQTSTIIAPPVKVSSFQNSQDQELSSKAAEQVKKTSVIQQQATSLSVANSEKNAAVDDFPNIDRVFQLFTLGTTKLPIVETVTYSSSVPWFKGRPAWVADYATYYSTSRHFIARSLNGKPDYFTQKVSKGSRFNVFRKDKRINFYLLIDVSRCKMGFYYLDLDTNERILLKTYKVGLGRLDSQKPSGSLTPLGKYSLGSKVAIYKPGTLGYYQDQKIELIRVFGTRWLPFDEELEECTAPARGFGIHGAPWIVDEKNKKYFENRECIGKFDSDGCIRLALEDIEEIFSIVITKPTYVVLVKDFHEAKLPGVEVATPSR
jgi:lipoprotein-anchoring transpeptidase ErfK/SrfK